MRIFLSLHPPKSVHCVVVQDLNPLSLSYLIDGKNFDYYSNLSFDALVSELKEIDGNPIFEKIKEQIIERSSTLIRLGLSYLSLCRKSSTLSGGESQRLKLASILGNRISGILYIFDEPSIGLHGADNEELIKIFRELVNKGNSVVVVEHDRDTILASDYIIDIGPYAGYRGGEVLFQGDSKDFSLSDNITAKHILEDSTIKRSTLNSDYLSISGVKYNNLKRINPSFIKDGVNVVTGRSGSGKSSLLKVIKHYYETGERRYFQEIDTLGIEKMVEIDGKPVGKNSRSNPSTYTGVFDGIRKLFGKIDPSYTASSFSFNSGNGRCPSCLGSGEHTITMHYLDDIKTICSECEGKRFKPEILEIKYKGRNIYQVLEMEVDQAIELFKDEKKIMNILTTISKLGLGYLKLGQPTSTLSGGECKRLKLSKFLNKKVKNTLFLLDEPTTGLSVYDIKILLDNLHTIAEDGNTIIAVEHDQYFIAAGDHIVDLGPYGGDKGGEIIYQGSLEGLMSSNSITKTIFKSKKYLTEDTPLDYNSINVRGVETNNLQGLDIDIKKGEILLIKGGEGSGKKSLVSSIFSEANNLYLSSLSNYVRQFISNSWKGKYREIVNITPAIMVDEVDSSSNSIVANLSKIFDLYRLLFSRFSQYSVKVETKNRTNSLFSFSHIDGACEKCSGKGRINYIDLLPTADMDLSIEEGALFGSKPGKFFSEKDTQYLATFYTAMDQSKIEKYLPLNNYSKEQLDLIFYGDDKEYDVEWNFNRKGRVGTQKFRSKWVGFNNLANDDYLKNLKNVKLKQFKDIAYSKTCDSCGGKRYNSEVEKYSIGGFSISDLLSKDVESSLKIFNGLKIKHGGKLINRVIERLENLKRYKLSYLTLEREYSTLSTGEQQRLRLSTLSEDGLRDITYILDQPAIGLYHKDNHLVEDLVNNLKKSGNTVLITDATDRFNSVADEILELEKGSINFYDKPSNYKTEKAPEIIFERGDRTFSVKAATLHNLKDIDIDFYYNSLNLLYGPSGSGKSTLMNGVLGDSLLKGEPMGAKKVTGSFSKIIKVGKIKAKSILSYFELDKVIITKLSKSNKIKPSIFTSKSYCKTCKGIGIIKGNLDILCDIETRCYSCNGKGYQEDVLQYKLNDHDISELFSMSLKRLNLIVKDRKLDKLNYYFNLFGSEDIPLNRKIKDLGRWSRKALFIIHELLESEEDNLILIDEPAAGLDNKGVGNLMRIFVELLKNNTILITEHNEDLIRSTEAKLMLGPGSGDDGGYLVEE